MYKLSIYYYNRKHVFHHLKKYQSHNFISSHLKHYTLKRNMNSPESSHTSNNYGHYYLLCMLAILSAIFLSRVNVSIVRAVFKPVFFRKWLGTYASVNTNMRDDSRTFSEGGVELLEIFSSICGGIYSRVNCMAILANLSNSGEL